MLTRPARPMPEPAADVVERAPAPSASPASASREHGVDARRGRRRRRGRAQRSSAALADLGLPAADRAAAAGGAVRVDRHVADLAAVAGRAGQRLAVDDQPAADADLAGDEQDVVDADRRAAPVLGQGAKVRLVGDQDRHGRAERAAPAARPSGTSRQPRFGAIRPKPSLRRTTPTMATPTPISASRRRAAPARRGARARPGRRRSSSTECAAARPVDPDVLEDLAAEADDAPRRASRQRSRGPARRRRVGLGRTSGDGRPGVPCGAPRSSRPRPAAASSPMRPRMALRVSPVRATRSDRESGPPT